MEILRFLRSKLRDILSLGEDMAPTQETVAAIEDGVVFRGAKLWILVLAVFVASLGLNTNSAAVIIGAMLISPLMGPIIGMGLAVGINDFRLFKRAAKNYLVATVFSVATATIYFMLTPLDYAQSELLARISPTIYDVGIALCGGLAGIVALSSRSQRTGNVIPGVAIATALMPPLCTVGFGLGTGNWRFAAGALYLYLINTIFISLATFIGVNFIMRYPKKVFVDKAREKRVKHIISLISILTLIPSIFITVQIVKGTVFEKRCQAFYEKVLRCDKSWVADSKFDFEKKTISVVVLGDAVDSTQIARMEAQLKDYGLEGTKLNLKQGAKWLDEDRVRGMLSSEKAKTVATQQQLADMERQNQVLRDSLKLVRDSLAQYSCTDSISRRLLSEMSDLYPVVASLSMGRGTYCYRNDSAMLDSAVFVANVEVNGRMNSVDEARMRSWMAKRIGCSTLKVFVHRTR